MKFVSWKFIKYRTDRVNEPNYYGNDFTVSAQPTWRIAQDPLTLNNMDKPSDSYFNYEKNEMYRSQIAFISFGKSKLIERIVGLSKNKFVMDMAAGKGQDLYRYIPHFKKGLFLDIDSLAISTLMTRRSELIRDPKYSAFTMETYVGVEDLTKPKDEIYERIQEYLEPHKPGFINCNLAIHYLVYDEYHMRNFIGLVNQCLDANGIFSFTTFNGKKIAELIENGEWKVHQDEVLKYKIVKKYQGDWSMGSTISVKLPFSDDMYDEGLVDIEMLVREFGKFGFELLAEGSMGDYLSSFGNNSKKHAQNLSADDIEYASLYHYCILKKKN